MVRKASPVIKREKGGQYPKVSGSRNKREVGVRLTRKTPQGDESLFYSLKNTTEGGGGKKKLKAELVLGGKGKISWQKRITAKGPERFNLIVWRKSVGPKNRSGSRGTEKKRIEVGKAKNLRSHRET